MIKNGEGGGVFLLGEEVLGINVGWIRGEKEAVLLLGRRGELLTVVVEEGEAGDIADVVTGLDDSQGKLAIGFALSIVLVGVVESNCKTEEEVKAMDRIC